MTGFWVNLMTDLFEANISANKISLPQGQSYTEKEYYNGFKNLNLNLRERLMINLKMRTIDSLMDRQKNIQ